MTCTAADAEPCALSETGFRRITSIETTLLPIVARAPGNLRRTALNDKTALHVAESEGRITVAGAIEVTQTPAVVTIPPGVTYGLPNQSCANWSRLISAML